MTPSKEIGWVAVNGLLIADQCLLTNVSWDDLDVQGLVFGKEVTVQGLRFKMVYRNRGAEPICSACMAADDGQGCAYSLH